LLAIPIGRQFRPDIILLDVVMPSMDGGDVDTRLKQDPYLKDVPVLMMTALVSNRETGSDAVAECGSQVMMGKPLHFGKLLCAMEHRMCGVL
jgi:CheY-like chemotaxis protein